MPSRVTKWLGAIRSFAKPVAGAAFLTLVSSMAIADPAPQDSLSPGGQAAAAAQSVDNPNLVVNPGFEQGLQGWKLNTKNDPESILVKTGAHSGQGALRVRVPADTHYWDASFDLEQVVHGLQPDTWYELSLWTKTTNATNFRFGLGFGSPDWYTDVLPLNSPAWQRVAVKLKTGPGETNRKIRLQTWNRADEVLIDDVAVVEAGKPQAFVYPPSIGTAAEAREMAGFHVTPGAYHPDAYEESESVTGTLTFVTPSVGRLTILAKDGSGQEIPLCSTDLPGSTGASAATVSFCLSAQSFAHEGAVAVARLEGAANPVASIAIKRLNFAGMFPEMTRTQVSRLAALKSQAAAARLDSNAYVSMGLTIAGRYLDRVQRPDIRKKQMDYWTWVQLQEVASVLDRTEELLRNPLPDVPPIPFDQPRVDRGVFVAGTPPSPIFYGGYMGIHSHDDIPSFAGMGVSSIVIERGPNALGPDGNGKWALEGMRGAFEQANAAKTKVDMLLSPHYFPDWARKQAPDMASDRHGGIDYIIDHPAARKAIENWLRVVGPGLKDKPALMSFNLANEPCYWYSGKDRYSKPLWSEYLKSRHGSIEALNALYGTAFASFDDVPVPEEKGKTTGARCAFYDWFNFNAQHFTEWLRWMNGILKDGAPAIYTQVKVSSYPVDPNELKIGLDHEEIARFMDLAGCDGGTVQPGHQSLYAYGWQQGELQYDLLRSFRHQPVANSENHFISDGYQPQISPDYIRSSMWQGVLHGLGQTACWEFGDANRGGDGGIKLRPADIFAAGRAWLDARRCARIVAAVVRAQPHVAILYTRNSLYWQDEDYSKTLTAAYIALNFLGEPVTFVTEKELADGSAVPVHAILLPRATHVTDATVAALARFVARGGKLIAMGEGNLGRDEYDRPRRLPPALKLMPLPPSDDERVLFREFAPISHDLGVDAPLLNAKDASHAWGVEYRVVGDNGHTYLSALDQLKQSQVVKLSGGPRKQFKDLLSGNLVDGTHIRLEPMVPVLLDLGAAAGKD